MAAITASLAPTEADDATNLPAFGAGGRRRAAFFRLCRLRRAARLAAEPLLLLLLTPTPSVKPSCVSRRDPPP